MPKKSLLHFDISERKVLLRIVDMIVVLFTLTVVGIVFKFDYLKITESSYLWTLVLLIYLNIFASIFELYDLQQASKFEIVLQNVVITVSVTVLFYLLTPYYTPSLPDNRLQILFLFLSMVGSLLIWRYAYITLISSPRFNKRVMIVGDAIEIDLMVTALQKSDPNYVIIGFINTNIDLAVKSKYSNLIQFSSSNIKNTIKQQHINEIVVSSSPAQHSLSRIYKQLNRLLIKGFPIREYIQVYEEITYRVPVQYIDKDFYNFFPFSRSNQNKFYQSFHRMFDVVFSLIGLIFCILIVSFVILGNLLGNRGRLFYSQERVGRNAKLFTIYKFRTMAENAEINGPKWAEKNDNRVTPFGKFLRRTRLDELPQFYNILKGEMSIIGPRPERPVFVKELSTIMPFYATRHIIKPGLTGWAQVKANYGSSHDDSLEKLQYDLYYIKHRGLFLDIDILLKTFSTVLFFRGQ